MFSVYANDQLIYFPVEQDLVIISPKLSLEIGKAGSFQFGLPPTHRYYDYLQQLKTIITVEYDGVEIFRGRVLTINRGFNKVRQVMCEGNLAYLVDSVQKGVKYKGTTHALFRQIISNHNKRVEAEKRFTVGQIDIVDKAIVITGSSTTADKLNSTKFDYDQIVLDSIVDDWLSTFDYIQETIIDYCGGYLRTRRVGNTTYIDLLKEYTDTTSQKIEFGRNLIDLMQEVKAEDVYSVLIPLGDDNLTIEKANNVVIMGLDGKRIYKNGDELVDEAAVELYGRIVKTHVFDGVNKANTLLDNGVDLLTEHENMPITITAKAVDMHMVDGSPDAIYIGNRVYINSAPHDLTEYLTCTKIEYDFNNPANNTYTFGNPKQSLTQRFKKDKAKSKKSSRSSAAKAATAGTNSVAEVTEGVATDLENSLKDEGKRIDAWLNVDPDAGHIDLGAFYKEYHGDKLTLKNQVGIDLDAIEGTINIYDDHYKVDDIGNVIENNLGIKLDGPQGTIDIFADHNLTSKMGDVLTNKLGINLNAPQGTMKIFADHEKTNKMGDILKNNLGINLDAPQGTMKIFADHEKTTKMGNVIKNNLGINLNAPQGTIDIFAKSKTVDKIGNVLKNNLGINLDSPKGKIDIFAQSTKIDKVSGVMSSNLGIKLDAPGGKINLFNKMARYDKLDNFLYNNLGIDIDSNAGKINIYNDHSSITKQGNIIKNNLGINLDAPNGKIDIFAQSKKIDKVSGVMSSNLGINLDAPNGKINIFNTSTTVDKVKGLIVKNLGIDLDNPSGKISFFSDWGTMWKNSARFEAMANGSEARVGMFTNFEERIGSLEIVTTSKKSTLFVKVDEMIVDATVKINDRLDALEGVFGTLKSDFQIAGSVHVGKFIDVKNEVTAGTRVYAGEKIQSKGAIYAYLNKEVATQEWVKNSLTKIGHNFTFDKDLTINGSLNINSNISLSKSITQTKGSIDAKSLKENGKAVATQAWVNEQLKNYAKSTHKHTAYYAHTHEVNPDTMKTKTQSTNRSSTSGPI